MGIVKRFLGKVGVDNFQIITKTTSIKQGVNGVVRIFYQSLKNLKQKRCTVADSRYWQNRT